MIKKLEKRIVTSLIAATMIMSSASIAAETEASAATVATPTSNAAKKKVTFAQKKFTVQVKKKQKIKLLNNKQKVTSWRIKNPKIARIVKTKKQQVTIKALRKGKTKLYAKVGKKTYKCTINVVKKLPVAVPDQSATAATQNNKAPAKPGTTTQTKPTNAKPTTSTTTAKPGSGNGNGSGSQGAPVISDGTDTPSNPSAPTKPNIPSFEAPTNPQITGLIDGKVYRTGETIQLGVTGATTVQWMSQNTQVATVSESGLVKCVGEGTAVIKATINETTGVDVAIVVND